jgi:hypothetical protein
MVFHAYNPGYFRDGGNRIIIFEASPGKVRDPISNAKKI